VAALWDRAQFFHPTPGNGQFSPHSPEEPRHHVPARDTTATPIAAAGGHFPKLPQFPRVALNFSGSNGRKSAAVVRTVKKNSFNKRRAQEYELLAESIEGLWFQAELALALAFGPGKS